MSIDSPMLDCESCGACCSYGVPYLAASEAYRYYVEVTKGDHDRLEAAGKVRLIVLNENPRELAHGHMRMTKPNREIPSQCAALEGEIAKMVTCSIYKDRPNVCRDFEVGSTECLRARRLARHLGFKFSRSEK